MTRDEAIKIAKTDGYRADLSGANLRGADLRRADLDFSCWPLWCGSFGVKVSSDLARQLAYHLCKLECDDPDYAEVVSRIKDFANKADVIERYELEKIE